LIQARKSEASIPRATTADTASESLRKPAISRAEASSSTMELERIVLALPPRPGYTAAPSRMESLQTLANPVTEPEILADNATFTETDDGLEWQKYKVKSGYNLAIICSRAGVKASEVHTLMQMGKPVAALKKLYPNDKIRLKVLPDGALAALEYDINKTRRLVVTRNGETPNGNSIFDVATVEQALEPQIKHAAGVIEDSLFLAARAAGLTDKKAIELANIFAWDIDFALDVRRGDRFTVIYEEQHLNGERVDDGPIIAAEFINQNHVYRAVRYQNPEGETDYYAPDGSRLRKSFLRNPIKPGQFRISSHFNLKRKHPILHKIRAHKGVDYAASTGTPITATGDGKIVKRGKHGGYGSTVIIQHGQRYSTLYAHLSKFAANTGVGQRVRQGQTIGYVGRTGLATGPHLHYEFQIDGVHRNPLTLKHPSGTPVPEQHKADFLAKIQMPLAQLDTLVRLQQLALSDAAQGNDL
jgi:murein DD-endopeptidase MepM/ murein hydrolase activator NlpD